MLPLFCLVASEGSEFRLNIPESIQTIRHGANISRGAEGGLIMLRVNRFWTCIFCGLLNPLRNEICERCGSAKPIREGIIID